MTQYSSKTYSNIKNSTGKANGVVFDPIGQPIIGNSNKIGSANIIDLLSGVNNPNVGSALRDLYMTSVDPIGSIIINTSGETPNGTGTQIVLTFDGKYTPYFPSDLNEGEMVDDILYGVPVKLKIGSNEDEIIQAFIIGVNEYIEKNICFSSVSYNKDSGPIVTLNLISSQFIEELPQYRFGQQCVIDTTIESLGVPGYGLWDLIGTEEKLLIGQDDPITLYYFKRIA